jgi:hypothetical protein
MLIAQSHMILHLAEIPSQMALFLGLAQLPTRLLEYMNLSFRGSSPGNMFCLLLYSLYFNLDFFMHVCYYIVYILNLISFFFYM